MPINQAVAMTLLFSIILLMSVFLALSSDEKSKNPYTLISVLVVGVIAYQWISYFNTEHQNDLLTKGMTSFPAHFTYNSTGEGYKVHFKDLPECKASGKTFEEAYSNAIDAMTHCIASIVKKNQVMPQADKNPISMDTNQSMLVLITSDKKLFIELMK